MNEKGIIFDIKRYALHDGPGIRTTIFMKGCALGCWWCQNPEGINPKPEIIFRKEYKHNRENKKEIIGREVTKMDVMNEILKDWIFYEQSGGGVTFSGGEPLLQPNFLLDLAKACKENEINTALDTSGHALWGTLSKVKDYIDIFLFDIKLINDIDHKKYTGVSNTLILSNLKKLDLEGKKIFIRFPIIPTITDTEENITQLVEFLKSLNNVNEIDLLPYHKMAKGKYEKLHRNYKLSNLEPPSEERLNYLSKIFEKFGIIVKIGG